MTIQDLNTGNELINKINTITDIIEQYNSIQTQGVAITEVSFSTHSFSVYKILYQHPDGQIINNLAATFIAALTSYLGQLQQQFEQLCSSGGAD